MDYDYTLMEEKMKSLPEDLQIAMTSTDTSNIIQDIAEKHGLDVEQTGDLFDLTGYVMLGLIPSKKFVSEITKQLKIDNTKANEITDDINTEVFGSIRASLQKIQDDEAASEAKNNLINTIENPSNSPVSASPINMLEEYPLVIPGQKSVQTTVPPAPIAPKVIVPAATPSLNLMDRMMSSPISTKNETVEKKAGEKPSAGPAPIAPLGKTVVPGSPDPYREPIE